LQAKTDDQRPISPSVIGGSRRSTADGAQYRQRIDGADTIGDMESLNRMATEIVDEAIDFADELGIEVYDLANGARVIDFGVNAPGGIEAGLLCTEIQTAGLATASTRLGEVAGAPIPQVELTTDRPALALLGAQKAGWELSVGEFEGLGSGPARALVAGEDVFERIGYRDDFDFAVLATEADRLPNEAVAEQIADVAGVAPASVAICSFATGSVVGSVTVASRAAELAMFRLAELGYDPLAVRSISGSASVAPISHDEDVAIGRTNDALVYGGHVHLVVEEDFAEFDRVHSAAATEYGRPSEDVFEEADWDFSDVPEGFFAPAQVTIDVIDGPTHVQGDTDESVVAESFEIA
jgi:methenyltetrahydromethanopterin cyclohydrolase